MKKYKSALLKHNNACRNKATIKNCVSCGSTLPKNGMKAYGTYLRNKKNELVGKFIFCQLRCATHYATAKWLGVK